MVDQPLNDLAACLVGQLSFITAPELRDVVLGFVETLLRDGEKSCHIFWHGCTRWGISCLCGLVPSSCRRYLMWLWYLHVLRTGRFSDTFLFSLPVAVWRTSVCCAYWRCAAKSASSISVLIRDTSTIGLFLRAPNTTHPFRGFLCSSPPFILPRNDGRRSWDDSKRLY